MINTIKKYFILTFSALLFFASANAGDNAPDTGKKLLLASLDKKNNKGYVTLESNVVYPEILAGHEEESLKYVGDFAERRRDYIIRTYTKGKKFFPKAVAILNKYNIPDELKVLLALESAFNGNAVSKAGAVGYWQFMDAAAKQYGLRIASKEVAIVKTKAVKRGKAVKVKTKAAIVTDDRKNFNKSTAAAAKYFRDRYKNLDGDWLLIVASYNCGIGNVWNAMERCAVKSPDFWDVKSFLPAETRAYVMNFIALNVIFNNYEGFLNNTLRFEPIKVKASDLENTGGTDEDAVSGTK